MNNDKEIEIIDDKEIKPQVENKDQNNKEVIVKLPEWSIEPPLQIKRDK
ncbi:MAG: hypothetical protein IJF92_01725 [Bacilli bacterium]|nr:hypothetical protein [Bacilli bacterium]